MENEKSASKKTISEVFQKEREKEKALIEKIQKTLQKMKDLYGIKDKD